MPEAAGTASGRIGAALSALLFVGSVLCFIWVVQPLRRPVLAALFLLYIVLLAVAINIRAGESPRDVGFRVDDLGRAARAALAPTLALALLIGIGALVTGGHTRPRALAIGLVLYPLWGLLQQYALQGIVHRRLRRAGTGALASPLAAALFALVHAPNPGLMALTFVGGWVWCEVYRRAPNLFVLGVSHGLLATLTLALLPLRLTGDLQIGPHYLRYLARHRSAVAVVAPAPPSPPSFTLGRTPSRRLPVPRSAPGTGGAPGSPATAAAAGSQRSGRMGEAASSPTTVFQGRTRQLRTSPLRTYGSAPAKASAASGE